MNDEVSQEEVSDYDKEWELDNDDSEESFEDADDDQQSSEESTDSEDAPESKGSDASDNSTESREDGDEEEDIWANVPEAAREAYRRAENARLAAENRAKVNGDKLAERGRELKSLRDRTRELEEANREPTEFEKEFEQYGSDVQEIVNRALDARGLVPDAPEEKTPEQVEEEFFTALTEAHPDAGDVYNSEGLQQMLADDPPLRIGGRAVLFSEALHSDEAEKVIEALNHYKSTIPSSQDDIGKDPLANLDSPQGGSPRQDMRRADQLSHQEQYDREWELDDD